MDGLENCGFFDLDVNLLCLYGWIICKVICFLLLVILIDVDLLWLWDKLFMSCNVSDFICLKENWCINIGK